MGQIVRRVAQSPLVAGDPHLLPAKPHRGEGLVVQSQLYIGALPELRLAWAVLPSYWTKGCRLLLFHNTNGFCPERNPPDIGQHGALVVETWHDDAHVLHPGEGSHFLTFVLARKGFFSSLWDWHSEPLRFSVQVPSAKLALSRIQDQIFFEEMRQQHDLAPLEYEARVNEARVRVLHSRRKLAAIESSQQGRGGTGDRLLDEELAAIDALVSTVFAQQQKLEDVKQNPKFKKLRPKARKAVLETIKERLDVAEMSARREMRTVE